MKIHPVKQGTREWRKARAGVPTASQFHKIITPGGKPSAQADGYLARLCAEWFLGEPIEDYSSKFMERGNELEPEARKWFAFEIDRDIEEVGFCTTDDDRAGCSPDGLIGTDGGMEIKCPGAETQMGFVLHGIETDYHVQVQGNLWVAEREWWELVCFNPVLPKFRKRYGRDEKFIESMAAAVKAFCLRLEEAKAGLADEKAASEAANEQRALLADHEF